LAPLAKIAVQLNRQGIRNINIAPCLQEKAKQSFDHHQLIYLPDDTHWNAEGAECGVEALSSLFK